MRKTYSSVRLTESAVMLAMATVLSLVRIVQMPYGGSVTAVSMLPLMLIAYRYGVAWGLFTGLVGAVLQMLLDLNTLSWATSAWAAVAIILLDYVLAFTATGLAGLFRGKMSQPAALGCGAALACLVRFVCHIVSGCTVWAGLSIPTKDAFWYSVVYNAVYMIPETVMTAAAAVLIGRLLDFERPQIVPLKRDAGRRAKPFAAAAWIVAALVDVLLLFSATQVTAADGSVVFDITGIWSADWWMIAAVTTLGGVVAFVPKKTCPWATLAVGLLFMRIGMLLPGRLLVAAGFGCVCAVVALCLIGRFAVAAAVAPLLWDTLYFVGTWPQLPQGVAWLTVALPPVCGAAAAVLLKKKMTAIPEKS